MFAYRIWTWVAIGLLAFGSVAVFIVFLVTSWKELFGSASPDNEPDSR